MPKKESSRKIQQLQVAYLHSSLPLPFSRFACLSAKFMNAASSFTALESIHFESFHNSHFCKCLGQVTWNVVWQNMLHWLSMGKAGIFIEITYGRAQWDCMNCMDCMIEKFIMAANIFTKWESVPRPKSIDGWDCKKTSLDVGTRLLIHLILVHVLKLYRVSQKRRGAFGGV